MSRPFVYFSEAVLTPSKHVGIIAETARKLGAKPRVDPTRLWAETALSVRSQARLQHLPGFKGEKFHRWLRACVETLASNCEFAAPANAEKFRKLLLARLFKPEAYYVPGDVRQLLADLDAARIGWGILANESHLYQAVLQRLNLRPTGPVLQAAGPQLFKPLPQMWQWAVNKAPAQTEPWFVGSQAAPCDNMSANMRIRCALVAPDLAQADPPSMHFRVPSVDDLRAHWFKKDLLLDFEAGDPDLLEEQDEVVHTQFVPKLPPRQEQEQSIAQARQKQKDHS